MAVLPTGPARSPDIWRNGLWDVQGCLAPKTPLCGLGDFPTYRRGPWHSHHTEALAQQVDGGPNEDMEAQGVRVGRLL